MAYLCICNSVPQSRFEEELKEDDGSSDLESLYLRCTGGTPMNCGTCKGAFEAVMAQQPCTANQADSDTPAKSTEPRLYGRDCGDKARSPCGARP